MDRSRFSLTTAQIFALIAALIVLFVVIASIEPLGLARNIPAPTKMLIFLLTLACGAAAGAVGIRGLWK